MRRVEKWIREVSLPQVAVVNATVKNLYGRVELLPNVNAIRAMCVEMDMDLEDALYEVEERLSRINLH